MSLPRRTALAAAAASVLAGRTTRAAPAAPASVPASAFIDSVGVCVHLTLEPYRSRFARFRSLLAGSGIRHLREEIRTGIDLSRWRDLHAGHGIRFNLLVSPVTNTAPQMMELIESLPPGTVSAVEGQNEGNSEWFKKSPAARGDWATTTIAYQRDIYEAVRRRFSPAQMPVLSPTLLDFRPRDTPLIRDAAPYCDIVALHSYVQHAQEPETGEFAAGLAWYIKNFREPFKPGAPTMVTETGYTNVVSPNGNGLSPLASSVYLPRLLLNNFQAGMIRTFLYEFMDDGTEPANNEHHYGLVGPDGTPKPAYATVSALMKALDDRDNPSRDTPRPRAPIAVSFPDAPPDLRQQAFTRRDGTTVVAAWRPVRAWDVAAGRDMELPTVPVTMVAQPGATWRSMVLDGTSAWTDPTPVGASVRLPVGGRVTLVRLAEARS